MKLDSVLTAAGLSPVLIDVGASGAPPPVWKPIAPLSIYVGFDPDLRDLHEPTATPYRKAIIVNKAVASQSDSAQVQFYLTESPYCSSTLLPDSASLSEYLFADLFRVKEQVSAPAITLNQVIEQLGLSSIDWLKIDTQGTDLRIFTSLSDKLRAGVLAVDAEPGLIDAYQGEDLFIDLHRRMTTEGFWLSNLNVEAAVRMRPETLKHIPGISSETDKNLLARALKRSPAWCEARYLRRLDSLTQSDTRAYILLWAFALLDHQLGFAWDVLTAYERIFGADTQAQAMKTILQTETNARLVPLRRIERIKSLVRPILKVIRKRP